MKLHPGRTLAGLCVAGLFTATAVQARLVVAGAVYTLTNAATGNQVKVFTRLADGRLRSGDSFDTGGLGTGGSLGNQGALVLSHDHKWLYAANAASDDVTVFAVNGMKSLQLIAKVPSGGRQPISLALHDDLLYVLHSGGLVGSNDSITGFRIGLDGIPVAIPGALQPLSGVSTDPAQIGFSPSGDVLVVTEKMTNNIVTYTVDSDGLASTPKVQAAAGVTPFGFEFGKRDLLVVSEAFGGERDASAVSTYRVSPDGTLTVIAASVPTTETAACWVALTVDGRFAYVTNTGSDSVSGYRVAFFGGLKLLRHTGRSASVPKRSHPTDVALSSDGRYIYVLGSADGSISGFEISTAGLLLPRIRIDGLPANATGLVAR